MKCNFNDRMSVNDLYQWPWTNHLSLLWIYPYTTSGFISDNKALFILFLNLKLDCVGINTIKKEYYNW